MAPTSGRCAPRKLGLMLMVSVCWHVAVSEVTVGAQSIVPLTCDVPVAATIANPLETDDFSFAVVEGERVAITVQNGAASSGNFGVNWRLRNGTGLSVCGGPYAGRGECGPLATTGNPYRVEVFEAGADGTGAYQVHLFRLTAGSTCDEVPQACDQTTPASIDQPLETDMFGFAVVDTERVAITVLAGAASSGSFAVNWRLYNGAGYSVCGGPYAGRSECGPLAASGNPYRIEVFEAGRDATGAYVVHLYRLAAGSACDEAMVGCDVPTAASIDTALDVDMFGFTVTEGERASITVLDGTSSGGSFGVNWRLYNGAGYSVCGGPYAGHVDCGPLSASGNPYRVEVFDSGRNGTGTYSVTVRFLVLGCPAVPPFTITGLVRDLNDTGVPTVTMALAGSASATVQTDVNGQYAFTNLAQGGTFTVTPSRPTFTFNPPSRTFANLQSNQTASFVATSGTFTRYLSEGATGTFFDTQISLLNATSVPADVTVRFQRDDGVVVPEPFSMAAVSRATVDPEVLPGLEQAAFATVVESTQPVIVDRLMRWDATGYGSHAETSVARPETVWYLAEGATTGSFSLFYLFQNPNAQDAQVEVRFLRPAPQAPIVKSYTVRATSRLTLFVNDADPALDEAEVSAVVTSTNAVPIIVERAMYTNAGGRIFGAGHESAAIHELATSWFLAEGATGPFFHLFILVANPGSTDAALEAQYLLPNGTVVTRNYTAGANSRLTISVHAEGPELANTPVSTTITSTNGVPVLVERAMWWPATAPEWYEGHNSAGAVATGEKWGLALGEAGGADTVQTYILIANTSPTSATVRVRLVFEDGASADRTYTLLAHSRFNVFCNADFPAAVGRRFGAIVESLGTTPAQIVVERALYSNAQGVVWAAGANALGTRLR